MTQPYCKRWTFSADEDGIYIPVFVFLSVFMLALLAAVVDIGTVARTRLRLQKAVDAGVLAGLAYRLQSDSSTPAEVEQRAQRFVEENLRLYGFPVGTAGLTITPPRFVAALPESLSTEVRYNVPLLLLPFVPTEILSHARVPDRYQVPATARGVIPRANIMLVLDTSSSMACPVSDPDCSCGGPGGIGCNLAPDPGIAKIYELRRAVFQFLKSFREDWDRIALISFDGVSQTLVSFDRNGDGLADGFRVSDFTNALGADKASLPAAFRPGGLTNPSDGLLTAYDEASRLEIQTTAGTKKKFFGNEKINIVFFTDGAPTAQTGCYRSTFPALPATTDSPSCPSSAGKRYTQLEFEWADAFGNRTRNSSPLFSREKLVALPKSDRIPQRFVTANLVTPACGAVSQDIAQSLAPCVDDLSSVLPGTESSQVKEPLDRYKRSFYHRTLAVAKYLQRHQTIIYAIGFGPGAAPAVDPKADLYQNSLDDFHRKDGFLLLLANDLKQASGELKLADGTYPVMSFSDEWTMEQRLKDRSLGFDLEGDYLRGYEAAEPGSQQGLSQLFGTIAHKILVRMVL